MGSSGGNDLEQFDRGLPVAKLLIRQGADPELKDPEGNTALDLAIRYRPEEVVQSLRKALRDKWEDVY